jgi:tripartite-type tricarboxylate transporter receptor subunit TctC
MPVSLRADAGRPRAHEIKCSLLAKPSVANGIWRQKMKPLKPILVLMSTLMATTTGGTALAQEFPTRPIRLLVGFPAGGTVDGVARIIAPALANALGQSIVVENRAGATGSIAATEVANSPADGYTIGLVFDSHAVNHHLYRKLRYDPFKSFTYISRLVTAPQILVASNNIPASTPEELIKYAKANPGKLNYASTGAGSSNHLNALLFIKQAGIEATHVPYKGGAPAIVDMSGGQSEMFMIVSAPSTMPHVLTGRIKAIGVGSPGPLSHLPGLRPIADTLPGYTASSWVGIIAPAGLPNNINARLQKDIRKVLESKDVTDRMTKAGYEIVGSSSEEFIAFMKEQSDLFGKVVRDNKLQLD